MCIYIYIYIYTHMYISLLLAGRISVLMRRDRPWQRSCPTDATRARGHAVISFQKLFGCMLRSGQATTPGFENLALSFRRPNL